jgi:hypothetical protein
MLPEGYDNHLLISASGFSKMCKDMITISKLFLDVTLLVFTKKDATHILEFRINILIY